MQAFMLEHLSIKISNCQFEGLNQKLVVSHLFVLYFEAESTVGNQVSQLKTGQALGVASGVFKRFRSKQHNLAADREAVKNKKNDQGNHECEVFGAGPEAAESAYAWRNCTKNCGHANFIPVTDFCLDNLPKWCNLSTVVDYVKTIAALTVRLRVSYTSYDRPDGYSFCNHRGSTMPHTGSGWVRNVFIGSGPCRCPKCQKSSSPRQEWYEVHLETACHVIYNSEEAQATEVDFFYDDERSRLKGRTKTIHALENRTQNSDDDTCTLVCATHDQYLANLLQMYLKDTAKTKFFGPPKVWSLPEWENLCIIVSHPHGQPKQVTVGEVTGSKAEGDHRFLTYATDTCPGSSGAPVMVMKFDELGLCKYSASYPSLLPAHSQSLPEEGVNQSSATSTAYPESYYPLKQHK